MFGRGKTYLWSTLGLLGIVVGFWPTFYGHPHLNDLPHTLHGLAATLWVLLLIVQSLLIGRQRRALHARLGYLSLVLFATLVGTTAYMISLQLTAQPSFSPAVRQQLLFLDITFLLFFILLYTLAFLFRRKPVLHARLMGSTVLIGLGPSLVRLYARQFPALRGLSGALPLTILSLELILLLTIGLLALRRQTLRPFPALLGAFLLIHLGMAWSAGPGFASFLRALGSPV